MADLSCIVISDYAKGLITEELMAQVRTLAGQSGVPIIVDPKVEHMPYYAGVTVITPNYLEAKQGAGISSDSRHSDSSDRQGASTTFAMSSCRRHKRRRGDEYL